MCRPTAEQRQAWAEALTRLDDHSKTMIKVCVNRSSTDFVQRRPCIYIYVCVCVLQMASRHDTEAFLASARDTTRLAKQLLDQLVAAFGE